MNESQVLIIGGGVSGLCAAHYLSEALGPDAVRLLEAGPGVGGKTGTDSVDGFISDWGPNGFLDKEPLTLKWIDDIGLSDQLIRANENAARRFIVKDNRLLEVSGPPKFFLSPLLPIRGRIRMCFEPFIPAKRDDEPESIWSFAARRIGRYAADWMVRPMTLGVFGGDATKLSLRHCFPRMWSMEREYGGLVKALLAKRRHKEKVSPTGPRGVLTTFRDGSGVLPSHAARRLGTSVDTDARVVLLERDGAKWRATTEDGRTYTAACVVLAAPAPDAAKMLANFDSRLTTALCNIAYANMAVVCVGYRRENVRHDLNGFGFLVPPNQNKRVLGCLWTSSLFEDRAPEGYVQLRAMIGGYNDPDATNLTDDELIETVQRDVHPLLNIDGKPDYVRIFRHVPAIPQYLLHHQECLDAVDAAEATYPGLIFAGNAYRGVALNDCVVSAHRAVDLAKAHLQVGRIMD